MQRPTKFEILGLFGSRNITIPIEDDALILVGPNGVGKSSVINIFYFFISRQWSRLAEYHFSEVAIWFDDYEIRAARADITGLSQFDKVMAAVPISSRSGQFLERLRTEGLLEEFTSKKRLSPLARQSFADALGVSTDEVRNFQFSVMRRLSALGDEDLFSAPRITIERQISAHLPQRTLYLPTYRRIEKDIQDIFPDLEDRLRASSRIEDALRFTRSAKHYIDLVSFGMEDVRENIAAKAAYLRDYSLAQFNDLSGLYLRDVIKGTADQFSPSQIAKLDENGLSVILGRVSEEVLSDEDKALLRTKILDIKAKKKKDMEVNDLYLAHYFGRLMNASADISSQETEFAAFVEVCNAYLAPGKKMVYDDTKFTVIIMDQEDRVIDLSMLSSGEKQVVSLFSHLYLDDARDQIVIIDEPELSLSVPWQKRFLPDILDSGHCSFIMSVTHSPFIYQNRLKNASLDLRRKTTTSKSN